jgi:hypothetical protein
MLHEHFSSSSFGTAPYHLLPLVDFFQEQLILQHLFEHLLNTVTAVTMSNSVNFEFSAQSPSASAAFLMFDECPGGPRSAIQSFTALRCFGILCLGQKNFGLIVGGSWQISGRFHVVGVALRRHSNDRCSIISNTHALHIVFLAIVPRPSESRLVQTLRSH